MLIEKAIYIKLYYLNPDNCYYMVPYEVIYSLTEAILKIDKSIRWVCVANKDGIIINERTRDGLKLLLTEEENEEYAANAISRQKTRRKFEPKIGGLIYAFGKYENVNRATIPINENYYVLLTFDSRESDFDQIIMDKIIPNIHKNKEQFNSDA